MLLRMLEMIRDNLLVWPLLEILSLWFRKAEIYYLFDTVAWAILLEGFLLATIIYIAWRNLVSGIRMMEDNFFNNFIVLILGF